MSTVFKSKKQNKIKSRVKPVANKPANKRKKNEVDVKITRPNVFEIEDLLADDSDDDDIFDQKIKKKKSTVFEPRRQNKPSSRVKPVANKPANKRKKNELDVKITRPNVFEIKDLLADDSDDDLDIFDRKVLKESTLPSIRTLLSSNNKDSKETLVLHDAIEKSQQPMIKKKYCQNEDIFISKYVNSTLMDNKHIDESVSLPVVNEDKELQRYSISNMFSDGLSQKKSFGKEYRDFNCSDDAEPDLSPSVMIPSTRKADDFWTVENKQKKAKYLEKNEPSLFSDGKKLIRTNFGNDCQQELGASTKKSYNNSGRIDRKSFSFVNSSIDNSQRTKMRKSIENEERFILSRDSSTASFSAHKLHEENNSRSTSTIFDPGYSTFEITNEDDCEVGKTTINITLPECNLDHPTNSEHSTDESIKRMNKKALWYLDDNNSMENEIDSTPQRMNYNETENFALSKLTLSGLFVDEKNCVLESEDINNASQNNIQASDSFLEFFGSQLSDPSQISLPLYIPKLALSPNHKTSFTEKDSNRTKKRRSSFGIQNPFLKKKKIDDDTTVWKEFSFSNLNKKDLKRRYSYDEDVVFLNTTEVTGGKKNETLKISGIEPAQSETRFIENSESASASSEVSIVRFEKVINSPSRNKFWNVSHKVQSFVMEWLHKNDEINNGIPHRSGNEERTSFKRRRLDSGKNHGQETVDIDPKTLLSNFSFEHDSENRNKRFKP